MSSPKKPRLAPGEDGMPIEETVTRIVPAMMEFPAGTVSRDFLPYHHS